MRFWTTTELARFAEEYPRRLNAELAVMFGRTVPAMMNQAQKMGLHKSPEVIKRCRFKPGEKPWNVGITWAPEGSRATQFRKGKQPHNTKPIGAERLDKDGQRWVKVSDTKWRAVKDLVWEAAHGPIPSGYFVACADRNPANLSLDNLLCITRAENMRRNTVHRKAGAASEMQRKAWAKRKATPFAKYVRMAAGLE